MALLVNSHFAVFQSFGLWRFSNSPDLTSRSLQATDNGQRITDTGYRVWGYELKARALLKFIENP
ncbi:MAG: hypothetical protein M0R39_02545 [Prolixibacteraceae bacterium]|nr:hypothetical protein [Prolixibacteraceae bacterium]